MNKQKKSAWQGFLNALNLPLHTLAYKNHIEVFEQKEIIVEDALRILEYQDEDICILLRDKKLKISGHELRIDMFVEKTMIIRGNINSLRFE